MFPSTRLRRYRKNEGLRKMFSQPFPGPEKFIWPVFVIEGKGKEIPITAMPGQSRMTVDVLIKMLEPVVKSGIGGVMIFGVVEDSRKSLDGGYSFKKDGVVQKAICEIRKNYPRLLVFTDVCLCAYTRHGHCGIIDNDGDVENDMTLNILAKMAVSHAEAGAHSVAPSAMMDGQILAIRNALSMAGLKDTLLMAYSTKFASNFYGPFRNAADSRPGKGDRKGYQASFENLNIALKESVEDEKEGADILMVKPALCYLDIISKVKESTLLPVAAYNVSGEYSMIIASADRGWGDLNGMARESLMAISRAGADIILSYWANRYGDVFGSKT
ncbi:MAG: porphobilinogen synthase [Victivallales bacterium]